MLAARTDLPLRIIRSEENLGGAGGFHLGVGTAYDAGFDRIWLMDDDVVAAPECLQVLLDHPGPALMAVREDTAGRLVEKAALRFDLSNPLVDPAQARLGRRPLAPPRARCRRRWCWRTSRSRGSWCTGG